MCQVPYFAGHVDDGRQGSTTMRLGMKYDKTEKKFVMDEEQKMLDEQSGESVKGYARRQ